MFGNIINVLRYGGEVANAKAWKQGTINVAMFASFLSSLFGIAQHYGWLQFTLDGDTATRLATGIVTIGGVVVSLLTAATSARAGVLPAKQPDGLSDLNGTTVQEPRQDQP